MEELLTISKNRILLSDEDFQFLRTEGLKYIENLASHLWTDYNTHDPGITILEAFCYAITELGYRSNFEMQYLLADENNNINTGQTFYSAKNIFRNNPLTVEDYRKILIDTIGVHNAFMFPGKNVVDEIAANIPKTEVLFYPDCENDALVYNETHHNAIDLRGLYKVILDLDNSETFGDLNIGNIFYSLSDNNIIGLNVEAILPSWKDVDLKLPVLITNHITSVTVLENSDKSSWNVSISYQDGSIIKNFDYLIRKALNSIDINADTKITAELSEKHTQKKIFSLYRDKLNYVNSVLLECWKKINAERSLCEDFISVETVQYTGITVCCDIETSLESDIDEILGNVYFLIQEYFNPTINFYLLQEMITKGKQADEIFEGPSLIHGFIDSDELEQAQLRSEIRVSDIINLIMDIPGVIAVKNLLLTTYDSKGNVLESAQKWCVHLLPYHKPVLEIFKSKILFFKRKLPFIAKISEALNVLRLLEANNERPKLKGHRDDLPMPQGEHLQFDDYLTIQYEFPQTYGISAAGLSNEETYQRKAQAKQLRAYCMFYDQLLADFFSQLYHAKDLFSLNFSIDKTYFTQFLNGIKDIDAIYRNISVSQIDNEFSLQSVLSGPVAVPANTSDPNYKTAVALNDLYEKLIETKDTFFDRRNRFLDHLMGRFAETFNNYVFLLYTADKEKIAQDRLINDKILFLKDYPEISAERGKAFDYLQDAWPPPVDASYNVSGLQKRVCRFTGIHNYTQRNLFCFPGFEIIPNGSKFNFHIVNKQNEILLKSIKDFDTISITENVLNLVYDRMQRKANFKIAKNNAAVFEIQLFDEDAVQIAVAEKTFSNNLLANNYLRHLIKTFQPACDAEGMHLLEHILLRPHFAPVGPSPELDYKLMQVCLDRDCNFCGNEDPYSFRVSAFLPYWPQRFRDMDFRKYVDDVFEEETPAHIATKVCWLGYVSMKKFETIYIEWLTALKTYGIDLKKGNTIKMQQLKTANNKMIDFLKTVHSEYPVARLHDCETSVTNPVRLGTTVLGSF